MSPLSLVDLFLLPSPYQLKKIFKNFKQFLALEDQKIN